MSIQRQGDPPERWLERVKTYFERPDDACKATVLLWPILLSQIVAALRRLRLHDFEPVSHSSAVAYTEANCFDQRRIASTQVLIWWQDEAFHVLYFAFPGDEIGGSTCLLGLHARALQSVAGGKRSFKGHTIRFFNSNFKGGCHDVRWRYAHRDTNDDGMNDQIQLINCYWGRSPRHQVQLRLPLGCRYPLPDAVVAAQFDKHGSDWTAYTYRSTSGHDCAANSTLATAANSAWTALWCNDISQQLASAATTRYSRLSGVRVQRNNLSRAGSDTH